MKRFTPHIFCTLCLVVLSLQSIGQDRFDGIRQSLNTFQQSHPGLGQQVELSVTDLPLAEFLRGMAAAHQLNVTISPLVNGYVVNNFSDATVADVFIYLCKEYNLDIEIIGSILSFKPYVPPAIAPAPLPQRIPDVLYNDQTDFLSLDLTNDSLPLVARQITSQSLQNVILGPGVENQKVSVFIRNRPFLNALEKMAFANGLKVTKTDDNFYLIEAADRVEKDPPATAGRTPRGPSKNSARGVLDVEVQQDRLYVNASNVTIGEVIELVSHEMGRNYFMYHIPEGTTTLFIENATYEDFLTYVLNSTEYTYRQEQGVFLIGKRSTEMLRTTKLVRLENRTVETIIDLIPAEMKQDVEIKEFVELNGLILSGSHLNIREIESFIHQVDQVVPVVMIEVMIVDVNKSNGLNTGISMGLGGEGVPTETTGTYGREGVRTTINSASLNDLLNTINGFGLVNLGQVTNDFYVGIQALETNDKIRTRSTPKLATVNGNEANLTIGTEEFFEIQTTNTFAANSPVQTLATQFQSNKANLSIKIKPVVSGDEQITLDVLVEQSRFVPNGGNGPSDILTQSFESIIRVKNNDMIVLGGLENQTISQGGSGLPLLSRVPVLKWFVSTQNRQKSDSKLSIFIKPTVIY